MEYEHFGNRWAFIFDPLTSNTSSVSIGDSDVIIFCVKIYRNPQPRLSNSDLGENLGAVAQLKFHDKSRPNSELFYHCKIRGGVGGNFTSSA